MTVGDIRLRADEDAPGAMEVQERPREGCSHCMKSLSCILLSYGCRGAGWWSAVGR